MTTMTRRAFAAAALPTLLAGCVTRPEQLSLGLPGLSQIDPSYRSMYGDVEGEPFPVPAVDLSEIDPKYLRREVAYAGSHRPGTVVVDVNARFAYFVLPGQRAIRYGVGVGREEAFNFQGAATIARKAEWPGWTPTPNMIKREPKKYGPYASGMPGGPDNPLGPRALYLYRDGRDTFYRLHGTTDPSTIGTMVSSGCVRLINQDIIDLHRRVSVGATAIVMQSKRSLTASA